MLPKNISITERDGIENSIKRITVFGALHSWILASICLQNLMTGALCLINAHWKEFALWLFRKIYKTRNKGGNGENMVDYKDIVICVVPVVIIYLFIGRLILSIIIAFITFFAFAFSLISDGSSNGAFSLLFCTAWVALWYITGSSGTAILIIALVFIALYSIRYLPNKIIKPQTTPKLSRCRWCNKPFKIEDLEEGYCKECRVLVAAALAHDRHPAYRSPKNP